MQSAPITVAPKATLPQEYAIDVAPLSSLSSSTRETGDVDEADVYDTLAVLSQVEENGDMRSRSVSEEAEGGLVKKTSTKRSWSSDVSFWWGCFSLCLFLYWGRNVGI